MFFDLNGRITFKSFLIQEKEYYNNLEDYISIDERRHNSQMGEDIIEMIVKVFPPEDIIEKYENLDVIIRFKIFLTQTSVENLWVLNTEEYEYQHSFVKMFNDIIVRYLKEIIDNNDDIKGVLISTKPSNFEKRLQEYLLQDGYKTIKYSNYLIYAKDNEFLKKVYNELFSEEGTLNAKTVAEKILKNCQPFLQEINYDVENLKLYRGMRKHSNVFIEKTVRLADRKPKDTKPRIHRILNKIFIDNFGYPFRNGLFVVGEQVIAKQYAHKIDPIGFKNQYVYSIFPKGKFSYIWSPKIEDLYNFVDVFIENSGGDIDINKLEEEIRESYILNEGLDRAIKRGNEIMIWVEEYYALMEGTEFENDVLNYIKQYNK